MQFVFDTNVLVSSVLFPSGTPAQAYAHASSVGQLVFSPATLTELEEVLRRSKFDKYLSAAARQEELTSVITTAVTIANHKETIIFCRDEKDIKFLQVARAANVSCLITGDNDLLELHPFYGIPIITPTSFLQTFK